MVALWSLLSTLNPKLSSFFIKLIHRNGDTCEAEALDNLACCGELFLDDCLILGAELAEHKVGLCTTGKVVADTKLQAGIVLPYELGDVLEAVVAAIATLGSESERAGRQREVIDHHEHILEGDILFLQPIAHGIAAEIHEGGGLEQRDLGILHTHVGYEAIALVFPCRISRFGQSIYHTESDVVARAVVFIARITQADNQVFHFLGVQEFRSAGVQTIVLGVQEFRSAGVQTIVSSLVVVNR